MAVHKRLKPRSKYQRITSYIKARPLRVSFGLIIFILLIVYLLTRNKNSNTQDIKSMNINTDIDISKNLSMPSSELMESVLPFENTNLVSDISDAVSSSKKYRYF